MKAVFCPLCGAEVSQAEIRVRKEYEKHPVPKDLSYKPVRHILDWLQTMEKLEAPGDAYIAAKAVLRGPPGARYVHGFKWDKPISIQHLDQILQELDPALTSHHFRYGGTERGFRRGYTAEEVKDIGGWKTLTMPLRYAERKGLTPTRKRFAKDLKI